MTQRQGVFLCRITDIFPACQIRYHSIDAALHHFDRDTTLLDLLAVIDISFQGNDLRIPIGFKYLCIPFREIFERRGRIKASSVAEGSGKAIVIPGIRHELTHVPQTTSSVIGHYGQLDILPKVLRKDLFLQRGCLFLQFRSSLTVFRPCAPVDTVTVSSIGDKRCPGMQGQSGIDRGRQNGFHIAGFCFFSQDIANFDACRLICLLSKIKTGHIRPQKYLYGIKDRTFSLAIFGNKYRQVIFKRCFHVFKTTEVFYFYRLDIHYCHPKRSLMV